MDNILEFFYKKKDFLNNYNWKLPKNSLILLPPDMNNVEKNFYLKEKINNFLKNKNHNENLDVYYWIINEWGGIRRFKRNKENDLKIINFFKEIENKKLSVKSFNTISSLSKIASFYDYSKYAILDSRVTFSLNWLILNFSKNKIFFPVTKGRNKKLNEEDYLKKRLKGRNFYKKSIAYFKYLEILKTINDEIFMNDKLYYSEMLLFVLAEEFVKEN